MDRYGSDLVPAVALRAQSSAGGTPTLAEIGYRSRRCTALGLNKMRVFQTMGRTAAVNAGNAECQ